MTPLQGKQSVFFVDFNPNHIFSILKKYFAENIQDVIDKNLVYLLDINFPDLETEEIIEGKEIGQSKDIHQFSTNEGQINYPAPSSIGSTRKSTDPETDQDWKIKATSTPSFFNSMKKLKKLAKVHGMKQEQYEHASSTTKLTQLLRERNFLGPKRVYHASSK